MMYTTQQLLAGLRRSSAMQDHTTSGVRHTGGRTYTNVGLTAIAAMLGIQVFAPGAAQMLVPQQASALAQVTDVKAGDDSQRPAALDNTLISAGEQRKVMIAELRTISQRLERVEMAVKGTITAKVIEMPASAKSDDKR